MLANNSSEPTAQAPLNQATLTFFMTSKNVMERRVYWALIAIAAVWRLFLTGDRDILATDAPHDEFWYINTAFHHIWNMPYDQMAFMHLQTYAGWLAGLHLLGIPARFALDLAWLAASAYLAFSMEKLTRKHWTALPIFLFLAFHPYTLLIFDRALAETLLTVLSAATLAAAIEVWNRRDEAPSWRSRSACAMYTVGFALAYQTRKEGIVIAVPLVLLFIWSLIRWRRWWQGGERRHLALSLMLAPALATLSLGVALCAGNYLVWGMWVRYELAAPGYARAMAALNSIEAGPTPRQISVTKAMLELAYKESTTFRQLQPAMEHGVGQGWVAISRPYTMVPGEIGNGWFYWALRDVAAAATWHTSARKADAHYAAVADELEDAFAHGRLKRRFMLTSFLDPDFAKWLPLLPNSTANVFQLLTRPQLEDSGTPIENASVPQFGEYATVVGRRSASPQTSVAGWVIAPVGSLIGIGNPGAVSTWVRVGERARPDVPGAYAFEIASATSVTQDHLYLELSDGRRGEVGLAALKAGMTASFKGPAAAILGVDVLQMPTTYRRVNSLAPYLPKVYGWFSSMLCGLVFVSLLLALFKRHFSAPIVIIFLSAAAVMARILLFGILDASSWSGIQARYIMPVLPFLACGGMSGLAFVWDMVSKRWLGRMSG